MRRGVTRRTVWRSLLFDLTTSIKSGLEKKMRDERLELLLAISRRTLGIERFELTGIQTADCHLVSAEDIGRALESAYDA